MSNDYERLRNWILAVKVVQSDDDALAALEEMRRDGKRLDYVMEHLFITHDVGSDARRILTSREDLDEAMKKGAMKGGDAPRPTEKSTSPGRSDAPAAQIIHKLYICSGCACSQTLPAELQVCDCTCHLKDREQSAAGASATSECAARKAIREIHGYAMFHFESPEGALISIVKRCAAAFKHPCTCAELREEVERLITDNTEIAETARDALRARDLEAKRALEAAREKAEAALSAIRRIPVMPFPDPVAHSHRAFGDAVFRAYSDIQRIAAAFVGARKRGK